MLPELASLALLVLPSDVPTPAEPITPVEIITATQDPAPTPGAGTEGDDDLATKLANPVSDLISVPF